MVFMYFQGSRDELSPATAKLAWHTHSFNGYRCCIGHDRNVGGIIDTTSTRGVVGLVL